MRRIKYFALLYGVLQKIFFALLQGKEYFFIFGGVGASYPTFYSKIFRTMTFPDNLRYTEDHEWIRIAEGNTAYAGITDFAQGELGDIVFVEVDAVGDTFDKGDVFGTVEAVKTTSEMFMPVSGKIVAFNPKISAEGEDQPELVNNDPYGEGWIVKIEMSDPSELDDLMDAEAYASKVG